MNNKYLEKLAEMLEEQEKQANIVARLGAKKGNPFLDKALEKSKETLKGPMTVKGVPNPAYKKLLQGAK